MFTITIENDRFSTPLVKSLNDADILALENELLNPAQWIFDAIDGKINNCKKRMVRAEEARLKADPFIDTMPASDDGLVKSATKAKDYMNRKAREEAAAAKEE